MACARTRTPLQQGYSVCTTPHVHNEAPVRPHTLTHPHTRARACALPVHDHSPLTNNSTVPTYCGNGTRVARRVTLATRSVSVRDVSDGVRYEGPKGSPGMPEMLSPSAALVGANGL